VMTVATNRGRRARRDWARVGVEVSIMVKITKKS
jgi:hypothetical protein